MDAVPVAAASPPAPPRRQQPLLGFALDLLIAVAVMLAAGAMAGAGWAFVRTVQIGLQRGPGGLPLDAQQLDTQQLAQLLGTPGPLALLAIALVSTGSAALVAYFWRRRADRPDPLPARRAWRQPAVWGWALLAGATTFTLAQLVGWLSRRGGVELTPANLAVLEPSAQQQPWLVLGFVVLIAPLYEELLFRRVLFARLWSAGRPWLGLALSSAAFALLHEIPGLSGNPWSTTAALWLVYAAMGAAFAWVYRRTGSLWTAIGAHAANNLIASLALLAGPG